METFLPIKKKKLLSLVLISGVLFLCSLFLGTVTAHALMEKPKNNVAWHISATRGTHDNERGLYIADGDVVIKGGTTRLEADHVEFNNITKDAMARGNVLLISGEDTVTCEALSLNLATETGIIYDGIVFVQENNFYIKGKKITKTGKDTYIARKASLTSCSTDTPDWKISARDVRVTIGGYGVAKHATLLARDIPVLYTPILAFPAKTKRQTGLLTPEYSLSDRKGFELNLPLFLAINRTSDATLYADYMGKRGTKLGFEYRYLVDKRSKGSIFFDYLHDQKIDDGTTATEDYSYTSTPQRTNRDRYWFRMKHDQDLSKGWQAKLDLDVVSDPDYLHEFKDGYTGFTGTQKHFEDSFGRGMDDYDDTVRSNQLNLNKIWSVYSFNMDVDWYDDLVARRNNTDDTTLQTLPSLEFNTVRQKIGKSPLYMDLDWEYKNFFRNDTTDFMVRGQRTDIYPILYLPIKSHRYYSIEPSLGIRQTSWYTDAYEYASGSKEGFQHRELFDLNLKLSTEISKVFTPPGSFAQKIKHEITPALEYSYIPDVDQEDLPFFDSMDRIAGRNDVTWSVTNRFTSRKKNPGKKDPEKETYLYQEFAWIKLYQTWYMDDQIHYEEEVRFDSSQSFSDLSFESELSPFTWFSLNLDLDWSPYENRFMKYDTGFTLKDNKNDALNVVYRYRQERIEPMVQEPSETIYAKLDTSLTPKLNAFLVHEEDLFRNEKIETATGIEYHKECWSLLLSYKDKPDGRSFGFMVTLYGIGEFGQK